MSKIQPVLEKGSAFVAYITAGDGGLQRSLEACLALIEGGVDVLEIGVPFSDPVADGPVIQQAAQRALQNNTSLQEVLDLVKNIRQSSTVPIVLFSYYNPILLASQRGDFFAQAKAAGVDGCLVVDLPIEEAETHIKACSQAQIDPVFLISPNTSSDRMALVNQHSRGMLYYACRKGTTGVKQGLPEDFQEKLTQIKANTTLPVVAGFGVSNLQMATAILQHADGFVVGSLFVKAIADGQSAQQLTALAKSIDPKQN